MARLLAKFDGVIDVVEASPVLYDRMLTFGVIIVRVFDVLSNPRGNIVGDANFNPVYLVADHYSIVDRKFASDSQCQKSLNEKAGSNRLDWTFGLLQCLWLTRNIIVLVGSNMELQQLFKFVHNMRKGSFRFATPYIAVGRGASSDVPHALECQSSHATHLAAT